MKSCHWEMPNMRISSCSVRPLKKGGFLLIPILLVRWLLYHVVKSRCTARIRRKFNRLISLHCDHVFISVLCAAPEPPQLHLVDVAGGHVLRWGHGSSELHSKPRRSAGSPEPLPQ